MRRKHARLGVAFGLGGVLFAAGLMCGDAQAQTSSALTGLVSSSEEGAMEGVLVSAKKEGSTITTTVVTDERGRYSFPAARVEPGKYTITIRAIGYRLEGPKAVEVPAGSTGTADLKLGKVKSLVPQLSSGEWLLSLPGADKQKAFLTMAFGGPKAYTGKDMRAAHAHLVARGLNDSHFNAVAENLKLTLEELKVPEELISQVLAIAESTRSDVLGR